ncbi:MAG: hypothetical protein GY771_09045 [bacterium]|nr:hypothetical protein [bacterium]
MPDKRTDWREIQGELEDVLYGLYTWPYFGGLVEFNPESAGGVLDELTRGEYHVAVSIIEAYDLPNDSPNIALASYITTGILYYLYGETSTADHSFERAHTTLMATRLTVSNEAHAAVQHGRALLSEASGVLVNATEVLRSAIKSGTETGNEKGVAVARKNLGRVLLKSGQSKAAAGEFHAALAYFTGIGWERAEADCLRDLGFAEAAAGRPDDSILYYEMALAMFAMQNRPYTVVMGMCDLGSALMRASREDDARLLLKEARDKAETIRFPKAMGLALGLMGDLAREKGDLAEALGRYEEAMMVYKNADILDETALQTANVGSVLLELGRRDEAAVWLKRARDLFVEIGDEESAARIDEYFTD